MRRQSRELSIFSMSSLDLFASSLGAFILITIILMPFYLRQGSTDEQVPVECPEPEPVPECPICPAPQPVPVCQICPAPQPVPVCPMCPAPEPIPDCPEVPSPAPAVIEVADNLLVVTMEWSRRSDVDLHIHTPDGTYYYGNRRISGSPGKFVLDNQVGGRNAIEIWKTHLPTPGRYKICTVLFRQDVSSIDVKLLLDKPTGPVALPVQTLRDSRQERCPLEFEIDREYTYNQIRP